MDLLKLHSVTNKLLDRVEHIEKVQCTLFCAKISVNMLHKHKLMVAGVFISVASAVSGSNKTQSLSQFSDLFMVGPGRGAQAFHHMWKFI